MFEDFLREHIKDLIECSVDNYNIPEGKMEDIVCCLNNNENLWNIIDEAIYQEIDKYVVEEEVI